MPETLEIFDKVEQGSADWLALRRGVVTASVLSDMLAKPQSPSKPGMREKLLYRLAGERITEETSESYRNAAMDRGHEQEPMARADYNLTCKETVTQVGFGRLMDGKTVIVGASPDSLVGERGMLEIKTVSIERMLEIRRRGPSGHLATHRHQLQGNLWVFKRDWIDLMLYHPKVKPVVIRTERDPAYVSMLRTEVATFNREVDELAKLA